MASSAQLAFAVRAVNEASKTLKDVQGDLKGVGEKATISGGQLTELSEKSEGLGSKMGALALAAAGAVGAFASFQTLKTGIGIASELGGEVSRLTRETGLSAVEASKLIFAFDRFGVSGGQASTALGILAKKLQGVTDEETGAIGPGGKVVDVLKSLGIAAIGAEGALRPMGELLPEISDVFKNMPAGPEKTALAMNLFGKSGKDLIPILNKGSEGLKELGLDAERFGLILDDQRLTKIKDYKAAQKDLTATLEGLKLEIGMAVIPIMTLFAGVLVDGLLAAKGLAADGIAFLRKEAEKLAPVIVFAKEKLADARDIAIQVADVLRDKLQPPIEAIAGLLAGLFLSAATAVGDYLIDDFLPAVADFAALVGTTAYDAAKKFASFLSDEVLPPLEKVAGVIKDTLQPAIEKVTSVVKDNATPAFNAFGISLGAIIASAAGLDLAINVVGNSIDALGGAVVTIATIPNPFLVMAVGAAAVIAGLVLLETKTKFLSETVLPAFADAINGQVVPALNSMALSLETDVIPGLASFSQGVLDGARDIVDFYTPALKTVHGAYENIRDILGPLQQEWHANMDIITELTGVLWDNVEVILKVIALMGALQVSLPIAIVATFLAKWFEIKDFFKVTLPDAISTALLTMKVLVVDAFNDIVGFFSGLPGRLVNALGDLAGELGGAMKGGLNAVISAINGFIGKWNALSIPGFKVKIPLAPDINFGGFNFPDLPTIPMLSAQRGMHTTLAQDTLISAHAGERVDIGRGGGSPITIVINALDGESVRRIVPQIAYELQRHLRSQGAIGLVA